MNIMISGGSGFLGRALTKSFIADGHKVFVLTRGADVVDGAQMIQWDAKTTNGWGSLVNDMDAVIHLAGKSLSTFPWTPGVKRAFRDSRVLSGKAITEAIAQATRRPKILVQASGINHYGVTGATADESTPPADDFLARLTVEWENATQPVEELGVRRIVIRTSVVLAKEDGMLSLMALPVKLFAGGPMGNGKFAVPWIHVNDWVGATRRLMADESARGAYNLIAPAPTSNADFNRALAEVLHRPYWLPTPAFLLRILLGEMSVLVVDGRFVQPKRLLDSGYKFQFENIRSALDDLF
ncbi:MAG: TIGR01777 family oxidoreductase [Anaerolineales bacterium]|nr:TIGR01777 family oxidoreductase [Anaerolineales bacterium]